MATEKTLTNKEISRVTTGLVLLSRYDIPMGLAMDVAYSIQVLEPYNNTYKELLDELKDKCVKRDESGDFLSEDGELVFKKGKRKEYIESVEQLNSKEHTVKFEEVVTRKKLDEVFGEERDINGQIIVLLYPLF